MTPRPAGATGRYLATWSLDRAGDGLFYVGLGWMATRASGDLGAATILAAGTAPRLVVLLVGGALGDRWGLARTARGTLMARVALLVMFALVSIPASPSGLLLAGVAAGFGLVDAIHDPALNGLSGVLVRGPDLVRMQGAMNGVSQTAQMVAAPVGGALLAWRGDAIGWLGALLGLIALIALPVSGSPHEPVEHEQTGSVLGEAWATLAQAMRRREMRAMLMVFGVANFAATPAISAGIPLLADLRRWTAPQYGLVMACFALGCAAGAGILAIWGHRLRRPGRWAAASLLPGSLAVAVSGVSESYLWAGAAVAAAGVTFQAGAGSLMATIKHATATSEMARMMSVVQLSVYSLIPLGMLLFGAVAAASSAQAAQLLMGAVMLTGATAALLTKSLWSLEIQREEVKA